MTKAGGHRGIDPDGVAETEADHFGNCPICGALLDMRDLTQVLAHVHDAKIEVRSRAGRSAFMTRGALAGPTLVGLWRFRRCVQLNSGPQHLLLIGLPILR